MAMTMAMAMAATVATVRLLDLIMARRTFREGTRPIEWVVRGGLVLLALVLAFASVAQTLARITARRDMTRGHLLAPNNARITASLSMQQITDTTTNRRAAAALLAQAALQHDATAVQAVATLGLEAQFAGDTARARKLFTYAGKLSRRDLPTQLWAIEDAVARNDVPGTLRHYDIALRTAKKAPELLFPVLSAALTDSDLRTGIVRILLQRPPWGDGFIGYAAALGPDPVANAMFVMNLNRHGIAVSPDVLASAVNRLVKGDRVDLAWKMYATLKPGTKRDSVRNPRFTTAIGTPSAFDWQPINDGSISATIQYEKTGGVFDFAAPTSVGGPLLQQLEVLPPGTYRLEGQSSGINQSEQSLPYWVLTCRDGRELGRVVVPNSDRFGGVFRGQINVPASCPAQTLALVARPSDDISGTTGQISRIHLVRAPGS